MPRRPWNKKKRYNNCKRKKATYKGLKVSLPCRSRSLTKAAQGMIDDKIGTVPAAKKKLCRVVFMDSEMPLLLCTNKRRTPAQRKARAKNRWGRKSNCIKRNTNTGLFYRKAGCKT